VKIFGWYTTNGATRTAWWTSASTSGIVVDALPSYDRWAASRANGFLVRVDFNTRSPKSTATRVTDDFRIRSTLPLFEELLFARRDRRRLHALRAPEGSGVEKYSVEPVRRRLNELCRDVELLENLGSTRGRGQRPRSVRRSSRLRLLHQRSLQCVTPGSRVDHGAAHARAQCAGPNLRRETTTILEILEVPRALVAILAARRWATKLAIAKVLCEKADTVIVGVEWPTLRSFARRSIGSSLFDPSYVEQCAQLLSVGNVVIPPTPGAFLRRRPSARRGRGAGDLLRRRHSRRLRRSRHRPGSAEHFAEVIAKAATILWNGPMVSSKTRASPWHRSGARAVAKSDAVSVVGGVTRWRRCKPLVSRRRQLRLDGGGASLELVDWVTCPVRACAKVPSTDDDQPL